jgi:hypothetical protein
MLQSLTWFELPDGEGDQSRVDWRLADCSSQEAKLHFPEPALPTACFLANGHADVTHGVTRIVETSGALFNAKHSILGFQSLIGAWACFEPPAKLQLAPKRQTLQRCQRYCEQPRTLGAYSSLPKIFANDGATIPMLIANGPAFLPCVMGIFGSG